jgi:hypothetical protein
MNWQNVRRKWAKISKNRDHNVGFQMNCQNVRRKLAKIAKNRDYNIDPG